MKILLTVLLTTLSISVLANNNANNTTISPHIITYKLFGYGIDLGLEERTLTIENNTYTYTAKAQTQGLAKLIKNYKVNAQSIFTLKDGIKSNTFISTEYESDVIKKQVNLILYDEIITNTATDQQWKRADNTLDFLNIFIALSYDFQHNNPLIYHIADGKKIKKYEFKNKGLSEITIKGKLITAIKLTADTLEVFIAKQYDYLPIFIQKDTWKYELQAYRKLSMKNKIISTTKTN